MHAVSLCLTSVLLVAAGDTREEKIANDRLALQGSWEVVTAKRDDQDVPGERMARWTFQGSSFSYKSAKHEQKGSYRNLVNALNVRTIDFQLEGVPNAVKGSRGLYEVMGDTLTLCLGPPGSRPMNMGAKGSIVLTLRKVRP